MSKIYPGRHICDIVIGIPDTAVKTHTGFAKEMGGGIPKNIKKWKHMGKGGRIGKNKNKKVKGFTQCVTADGVVLQVSFY